jgi:hypothetical protein
MTNIYFNPHVGDRKDFVGKFSGTKNLAGALLRTRGITVWGTPADIVLNLTHLLFGFGSQWVMPRSYPSADKDVSDYNRKTRLKWVKSRFTSDIQKLVGQDTISQWYLKQQDTAKALKKVLSKSEVTNFAGFVDVEPACTEILNSPNFAGIKEKQAFIDQLNDLAKRNLSSDLSDEMLESFIVDMLIEAQGASAADVNTALEVEALSVNRHLLDLIDFSFVEYEAIDGSIVSTPIWTQQGTLWSIMNSYSNDIINELFCDLRPLSLNYVNSGVASGGYYRGYDEFVNSSSDLVDTCVPVKFVPAMIMREHPFSTIDSANVFVEILGVQVDSIYLGSIFSKEAKQGGRVVNVLPTLNDLIQESNPDAKAYKHLDVVVLDTRDIISENIGRSDNDECNLMEVISDGFMGKHMKFAVQDLQPIVTPISVMRNGLRVRSYTTRFARFSSKLRTNQGIDSVGTRYKIARWALLLDHWYQHNIEYLTGTMTTRAFPEIRVGYRLDISDRKESYYVEGVNHHWQYPEPMTTSLTLSRGQRNDPYPVYIKPQLNSTHGDRESLASRLAVFFRQVDPNAVRRALSADANISQYEVLEDQQNITDLPDQNTRTWGSNWQGFVTQDAFEIPTDDLPSFIKSEAQRSLSVAEQLISSITIKGSVSGVKK